jgi:hypothetical protein
LCGTKQYQSKVVGIFFCWAVKGRMGYSLFTSVIWAFDFFLAQ